MKSLWFTRKYSRIYSLALIITAIALVTLIQGGRAQVEQGPCTIPQYYNSNSQRWPPCATVEYEIGSNIQGDELAQLNRAIAGWNAANISNGSRVQFVPGSSSAPYYLWLGYSYVIEGSRHSLERLGSRTAPWKQSQNNIRFGTPHQQHGFVASPVQNRTIAASVVTHSSLSLTTEHLGFDGPSGSAFLPCSILMHLSYHSHRREQPAIILITSHPTPIQLKDLFH
jgi:hypothetical protein